MKWVWENQKKKTSGKAEEENGLLLQELMDEIP
jgi:hypothetical protein